MALHLYNRRIPKQDEGESLVSPKKKKKKTKKKTIIKERNPKNFKNIISKWLWLIDVHIYYYVDIKKKMVM